jgi:hypothetical protein
MNGSVGMIPWKFFEFVKMMLSWAFLYLDEEVNKVENIRFGLWKLG